MKVSVSNIFYSNGNSVLHSAGDSNSVKKSVLLTDYNDVRTAVDKGILTVDGVTLELSENVRNAIEAAKERQAKDNETVNALNMFIHDANVAKQQGDAMEEALDDQAKAMEIARRISKGGHVPMQDERALMEYSPELYQMAKQAAMLAKEHKKYDTLIKEDSEETKQYDADAGKMDTSYQVQVDVSLGDTPTVESVSEVAVSGESCLI